MLDGIETLEKVQFSSCFDGDLDVILDTNCHNSFGIAEEALISMKRD